MPPPPRAPPAPPARALLSLLLLLAPPAHLSSSSERAPSHRAPALAPLDADLVRDAPLYPPLQHSSPDYDDPEDLETSIEDSSSILVTPELTEDKTDDLSQNNDIDDNADAQEISEIGDIGDTNDISESIETEDERERKKRSSGTDWEKGAKGANGRRVQTADTILNIRGALRDAIGDAGAAPGPRASSRVDAFVIRPAAPAQPQAQAREAPQAQPSTNQVKHRELLVEAHARARIPCDLANVTDLRWYRDSELVNLPTSARGGEAIWAEPGGAVIARATRGDAAVWRCAGRDAGGNQVSGKPTQLLVYEAVRSLYLAVDGRRLDAGNTWVPVRDKMVLEVRCVAEGGVPAPELSWRLLALEPTLDHRPYLRVRPANYSREGVTWSLASVTAARELHNATLQCEAKQRRPAPESEREAPAIHTTKLEIHVTYPPSFVISRWPGFGVALWAGGAAALRCDVDANPPARAWWRRDDAPPDSAPPQGGAERGSSASLRWPALSVQHGGWYRCRASWLDQEYSSIGYYLNVLSPDETSSVPSGASETEGQGVEEGEEEEEVDHQKVDVPLGGNVQLHCPKGSVGCWWRRVLGNASEGAGWAPAGSHHAHGVLGIKEALYQEGGEYRCVGARGADLARLRELKRVTLRVTGGATARAVSATAVSGGWRLECGACGRALRVVWLLRGRAVPAALTPDLPQHCWRAVLHVTDPDEVWCIAGGAGGGAVAVFPPRAPAPARQTVRALHGHSSARTAPPAHLSSSSERAPSPRAPALAPLDADLVRDAPLYPPLQHSSPDYDDPEDLETSIEDSSSILVTPDLTEDKTDDLSQNNDIDDNADAQDISEIGDIGDTNDISESIETEDERERRKRSSGTDWEKGAKGANGRRVQTADTILNIRGALRDAIGDAGAAPGPRASSRVDAFVIRPAAPAQPQAQAREAPQAQPSTNQVKHRELLVEAHARARIPCDLANVTDLRWYRDSELVNLPTSARGGEAMWAEPGGAVIARATRGDAAVWRCAGRDAGGNQVSGKPTQLLVYEAVRSLYLAVDGRRLDAGNTWVPVRDKMVLEVRCVAEGGVPAPELSWRLLALEPTLDHRPYLRVRPANYSREGVTWSLASVTAARELHNATLQCEAKQRRPAPESEREAPAIHTTKLEIHVTYPPSFVISRWPGFGVALWAGGAAALRCDVDANPPARAWWRRDDAPPDSAPPQGGAERGSSASLRWPALSVQHGGWYRCRASWLDQEYSSIGYYLNVLSPDETSSVPSGASETEGQGVEEGEEEEEVDHQKVDVPLGGNVQLHCPKGSVGCWWRRVLGNASEGAGWAPAGSHHAHGVLGIKEALYQEGGEYRCVGARGADLARLRELKRVTLRVTGGATARAVSATAVSGGWRLECGACGRALRVVWLLRGRAVPAALTPDLPQHCWRAVLHVTDPDEVWCIAGGAGGGAVAVFPPRAPAPARQTVRALHGHSSARTGSLALLVLALVVRG